MQSNIHLSSESNAFPHLQSGYAYKCFPVRNIRRCNPDDGGAWLVEFKAEQRQKLESLTKKSNAKKKVIKNVEPNIKELTGFYLIKELHVDEPTELCCINISGKKLHPVKDENFNLFKNIVSIDASDNRLSLETFKTFPKLEELYLQVNGISCIHVTHKDFQNLTKLDLSYNICKEKALLNLGKLRNITELSLRGCGLSQLPPELARGYQVAESDSSERKEKAENKTRFPKLKQLDLSENELTDISTFASLAGLRKLESVNLSSNMISGVPHLRLMVAHRHFSLSTCADQSNSHLDNVFSENLKSNYIQPNVSSATKSPELGIKTGLDFDTNEKGTIQDSGIIATSANTVLNAVAEENDTLLTDRSNIIAGVNETLNNLITADSVDDLLNLNFAQELNFSLNTNLGEDDLELPGQKHDNGQNYEQSTADHLLNNDIKRPFTSLEVLDLSSNQIADEESLLALTSWPVLRDLKIWGNPLTVAFKGLPPVIEHHLQKMCGIKIHRKEPKQKGNHQPIAPSIATSAKTYRVKTDLPPIKRNNLLMIEAALTNAIEGKEAEKDEFQHSGEEKDSFKDRNSKSEEVKNQQPYQEQDNVFLTQVNEEREDMQNETEAPKDKDTPKKIKTPVDKKYKGARQIRQSSLGIIATNVSGTERVRSHFNTR